MPSTKMHVRIAHASVDKSRGFEALLRRAVQCSISLTAPRRRRGGLAGWWAGGLVGWWAGRRRAGGSVGLRADRLHGGPRLRVPTSKASPLVKSEHTFAVRHERRAWPGRSRVSSPAPEFAILVRKRAGCSVAEVPQEKKELDSVQTKMENPCVNSGSQVVNGIDN